MSNCLKSTAYYVYCFINRINDKKYIGKTNNLKKRLNAHKNASGANPHFHRAIKKYGINEFDFNIIGEYSTEKEALEMEIYYIDLYKANNRKYGYNLTKGGEGTSGFKYSKEAKQKMSESRTGDKNHFYGKSHTEETKIAISQANKGKSHGHKGVKRSKEYKKHLSIMMTGKMAGDKHPLWGVQRSEEIRNKISNSLKASGKVSGENNPNSKLTLLDINNIRLMYISNMYSYNKLAKIFNVGKTTIARIIKNPDYFSKGINNE